MSLKPKVGCEVIEESPFYLQNIVPNLNVQNQCQLRNETNYPHPKTRTSNFQNSFLPKIIRDWNNLETDIKMCDSLESFKKQLDMHQSFAPSWYSTGDCCLNIFHTWLQMLCSPLNDHLYSLIHVVDQRDCACVYIRDKINLNCLLYSNKQNQMITELNKLGFEPFAYQPAIWKCYVLWESKPKSISDHPTV